MSEGTYVVGDRVRYTDPMSGDSWDGEVRFVDPNGDLKVRFSEARFAYVTVGSVVPL